jgi:DEAD/DEAH box helicase domain-containing protein
LNFKSKFRYAWPSELVNPAAPIPLSPGYVIYNDAYLQNEAELHLIWRRWLWLFNIFQTLPGIFLATQTGLDGGDYSTLKFSAGARRTSSSQGAAHAAAWEAVIEQAMSALADGLRALMVAGLAPPDEVGYELEQAGEVVAEAELAWRQSKLVLLMPEHAHSASIWEANGWQALVAENEWPQRLANKLSNRTPPED